MKQFQLFLFLLICSFNISICAQTNVGLQTITIDGEKKINDKAIESLAYGVLNSTSDQTKDSLNVALKELLRNELSKTTAFRHAFEEVQSISILTPGDSAFRLFNWNVPYSDGSYNYECFLIKAGEKPILLDNRHDTLSQNEWIPALYYSVIEKKTKLQSYYTLLAWKGNDRLTTKKVIDVLWFDNKGGSRFGAPIFIEGKTSKTRIVFEFAAQSAMKLNYNTTLDRIEFDHLSPPRQSLTGIFEYYSPDLTFDAFAWQNDKWVLAEDIYIDRLKAEKELKKPKKKTAFEEEDYIEKDSFKGNKSLIEPK